MLIKQKYLRWIGIACIILGLAVSLFLGVYRWQAEKDYQAVEILVDYEQLKTLSKAQQLSLQSVAAQFREAGATGVVVRERTFGDLKTGGDLFVLMGSELAFQQSLNQQFFPELLPEKEKIYFFLQGKELFTEIYQNLQMKIEEVEAVQSGSWQIISIPLQVDDWENLGVGFSRQELQEINTGGLTIVPRIRSWEKATQASLDAMLAALQDLPGVSMITFNDEAIPGDAGYLAQKLQPLQVPVGTFEFYNQRGLTNLAFLLEKNVVRIHCINENEMKSSNETEALERYKLAVKERNIRALYVRLFGMENPQAAWEQGLSFIGRIAANLQAQGMTIGPVKSLASLPYSRILIFFVGVGVIGGGILFLNFFLAPHWTGLLGLAGLLGWGGLLYLEPMLARKGFALLAVIIFPLLAAMTMVQKQERTIPRAVGALLVMSGISLVGAFLMTGLLADKSFMLKLDQFSGVKIAHLLPLLILPVYFFFKHTEQKPLLAVGNVLKAPVLVWQVIAGVVLLAVVAVYLLRTGNGAPELVSTVELKFRELLNTLLMVRPRTKEFMIGHPLMLLVLYYGYCHQKLPVLLLGLIGQISLVNTYAHLHTPLAISFLRSFHGLWLGILLGIALLLVVRFAVGRVKRRLVDG
ncbi:MAG: hypothetical protein GX092_00995 [Clostridia bacterium]|jgi:hypothetical protein|nr:hypothetical protein [Clostridia bacterium]